MRLINDPEILGNFAAAIARQAAIDYIDAYRYLIHHRAPTERSSDKKIAEYNRARWTVEECERFFRSNMFGAICPTVSADWLITELKYEARYQTRERRPYNPF